MAKAKGNGVKMSPTKSIEGIDRNISNSINSSNNNKQQPQQQNGRTLISSSNRSDDESCSEVVIHVDTDIGPISIPISIPIDTDRCYRYSSFIFLLFFYFFFCRSWFLGWGKGDGGWGEKEYNDPNRSATIEKKASTNTKPSAAKEENIKSTENSTTNSIVTSSRVATMNRVYMYQQEQQP